MSSEVKVSLPAASLMLLQWFGIFTSVFFAVVLAMVASYFITRQLDIRDQAARQAAAERGIREVLESVKNAPMGKR